MIDPFESAGFVLSSCSLLLRLIDFSKSLTCFIFGDGSFCEPVLFSDDQIFPWEEGMVEFVAYQEIRYYNCCTFFL